ncbi:MAG: hypothetical protein GX815_06710 [Clostridiales bacterium]|jgi:hypothetical protein|nr:hypothetical protein [Clostridiales bacterium]
MDEKIFELLEKMYIEMQNMKSDMTTKEDLSIAKQELKHDIVRIENKMDKSDKALFDGYKLTYEKLVTLENKLDVVDENVIKHDKT